MSDPERCQDMLGNLTAYVDGELSETLCAEINRHLAECADCRIVVDSLRRTVSLYRTLPQPEMPGSVRERLYKTLDLEQYLSRRPD